MLYIIIYFQYMGTCIHEDKFYIVTEYVKNDNLKTVNKIQFIIKILLKYNIK